MNTKELCDLWANYTFSQYLEKNYKLNPNYQLYYNILNELGILNTVMDGNCTTNLPQNQEYASDIQFTEAFDYAITKKNKTICDYIIYIIWQLNKNGKDKETIKELVARGLKEFPSFFRKLSFKNLISNILTKENLNFTIKTNPKIDINQDIDIILTVNDKEYFLWLYQVTNSKIINIKDKLLKNKEEIPNGIHLFCPININDTNKTTEYKNWYFYNQNYTKDILNFIKEDIQVDYTLFKKILYFDSDTDSLISRPIIVKKQ